MKELFHRSFKDDLTQEVAVVYLRYEWVLSLRYKYVMDSENHLLECVLEAEAGMDFFNALVFSLRCSHCQ